MKNPLNDWKFLLAACAFLGFAPFFPEPHLWGKLKWIAGGAVGMQPLDWLDLLWHGAPFILLARLGILHLRDKRVRN